MAEGQSESLDISSTMEEISDRLESLREHGYNLFAVGMDSDDSIVVSLMDKFISLFVLPDDMDPENSGQVFEMSHQFAHRVSSPDGQNIVSFKAERNKILRKRRQKNHVRATLTGAEDDV